MTSQVGFVDAGGGKLAHENMLEPIRDLALANGYTVLRFVETGSSHELILRAPGLSGTEEIFLGFSTYQDATADYYNLAAAGFTGYVAGNSFDTQPGAQISGLPAHNSHIDYWLTMNGQRLVLAMKVGTPVYESCYLGKMLPYATPGQFPYPLVVGGMLSGKPATRFSDSVHSFCFRGNRPNMRLRWLDGSWIQPATWPWNSLALTSTSGFSNEAQGRDTGGTYPLLPVVLQGTPGLLGELDGVSYITGFNNAVENTLEIGGKTWVVVQDVSRTGFNDYIAMRLD